ncbi:cytosolic iron-sulfur cluster assembly factor NBP35 [Skeletonema marinoi]|uniref:Cytosolic Fe-S cluster assembly factor NUBP1 homolog n=1 Tax=Skeletonema marinoi TaxID=267567 RepID=A0AAD9D8C0_9STRA|nr:cytosolic iron-sulfur cluster assembly factor NBP35 [Skeletonema marinoi]
MSSAAPSNANDGCVGPTSQEAGKAAACAGCPNQGACSTGSFSSPAAVAAKEKEKANLHNALSEVSHVVLVLSGKGGVGKSTVSTQVAQSLSSRGYSVGLLDVTFVDRVSQEWQGARREVHQSQSGWTPVYANPNLAVMSISFLLEEGDAAVVWRGPRKNGLIKQFLTETDWGVGGLDYLIIDTPPGTSDEHISIVQYLNDARSSGQGASGAIVVTTPEEVSLADVRKELNFCKKTSVPVLGVIENMSGLQTRVSDMRFMNDESNDCTSDVLSLLKEKCPEVLNMMAITDVFPSAGTGPEGMANKFGVPYLGKLPLDPNLLKSCEDGVSFVDQYPSSPGTAPLNNIVDKLILALPVEDDEEDAMQT